MDFSSLAPPSEILDRIRSSTGRHWGILEVFAWRQKEDVLATLKGSRLTLSMRQLRDRKTTLLGRRRWRYPYAPIFSGEVKAASSGSVISGTLRLHRLVAWFEAVWSIAVTLMLVFGVLVPLFRGDLSANVIAGLFIGPILLSSLPLMRAMSRAFRQEDEEDLIAFLKEVTS